MATLKEWKNQEDLSDEDVLTLEHRDRVSAEGSALEIIYCACGCGEWWSRQRDQEGRKQRFIRGHVPRRKPRKIQAQSEIIERIYNALSTEMYETINHVAERVGIGRKVCLRNMEIIKLVLSLQPGRWLEVIELGEKTGYRRKPRRKEVS